ncbi:MAG: nuclear transport factor 2 family protein [Filimonas sp.]|nr:nuclear transport factor 2 family protein [Filimonas sp.]
MKHFLLSVSILITLSASAQSSTDSVKSVITGFFTALKNSDGVALKAYFTDSAILQTIDTKSGTPRVKTDTPAGFAAMVSRMPQGVADERITFDVVKIDGDLASVWTPYQFYLRDKLNHCGANSFQLVRTGGLWKIQYIIDTRRKDCQQ